MLFLIQTETTIAKLDTPIEERHSWHEDILLLWYSLPGFRRYGTIRMQVNFRAAITSETLQLPVDP